MASLRLTTCHCSPNARLCGLESQMFVRRRNFSLSGGFHFWSSSGSTLPRLAAHCQPWHAAWLPSWRLSCPSWPLEAPTSGHHPAAHCQPWHAAWPSSWRLSCPSWPLEAPTSGHHPAAHCQPWRAAWPPSWRLSYPSWPLEAPIIRQHIASLGTRLGLLPGGFLVLLGLWRLPLLGIIRQHIASLGTLLGLLPGGFLVLLGLILGSIGGGFLATIGFGLSLSCYLRLSFSAMAHNCPGCWFSQLPRLPSENSIVLSLTSETNTNTIIVNY
jgi:hypothetical protein